MSLAECETIIRNLKIDYPRLQLWQEEVKTRAEFHKYTEIMAVFGLAKNVRSYRSSMF